ncbi:MAG: response regulator [Gemmatimonadales bacterium]
MDSRTPLRILHADDDESFHLLVRHAFGAQSLDQKCTIYSVSDGTEAVDFVAGKGKYADRQAFPVPDLILLDQRMQAMDGIDALRLLRADRVGRRLPVVIFSTAVSEQLIERCYASGATLLVEKPMDYTRLGPVLRLLVDFALDVLRLPEFRS